MNDPALGAEDAVIRSLRPASVLAVCFATACGRFGFEHVVAGADAPVASDASSDASSDAAIDAQVDAPPDARAAITLVQQGSIEQGSSSASATVTLPGPVTAGDTLVLMITTDTKISQIKSVTGGGASWSQIGVGSGSGGSCASCIRGAMWLGSGAVGGSQTVTVTVQESALDDMAVVVTEWSHVGAFSGATVVGPVSDATIVTGPVATQPNDLVLAMGAWDRQSLSSGPTDGFLPLTESVVPNNSTIDTAWQLASGTSSPGTTWNLAAATQSWITIIAHFAHD